MRTTPGTDHPVYASSSSVRRERANAVFGGRQRRSPRQPLCGHEEVNELMAHTYSHLFKIPTGLRFLPYTGRGRADMAFFYFTAGFWRGNRSKCSITATMKGLTYVTMSSKVWCVLDHVPTSNPAAVDAPSPAQRFGALPAVQHRQQQPRPVVTLHRGTGRSSVARHKNNSWECSPVMFQTRLLTCPRWRVTLVTDHRRRSKSAYANLSTGTAAFTATRARRKARR